MRIEEDKKLDYSNVLLRPKRSTLISRKDVDVDRHFTFRNGKTFFNIPIMAANMDGVGTFEMADALGKLGLFTCLVKSYSVNQYVDFFDFDEKWMEPHQLQRHEYTAYTMGISNEDHEKFRMVYEQADRIKYVCIDVANGYTQRFSEFVSMFRKTYPEIVIIAGNVCTADQTQELILSGADIVKVGIGPGSVCTTRIQTGVGYPQLSAVMECADAAHGLGGHIIADGGCTTAGDVAKAFGGGADFVMLGGMLAGHKEGGGKVITKHFSTGEYKKVHDDGMSGEIPTLDRFVPVYEERKFVQFYGMSSDTANMKHFGGLKNYRSSEGRDVTVPYKGDIDNTVQDILGGLRSTCTYVGAAGLKQLSKCATFVRCYDTHNRVFEK